jgi:hypothetical protein
MLYLNARVQARVEEDGLAHEIPNLDWKVQSSLDLQNASFKEVRE